MTTILTISGSLRSGSLNTALLKAMQAANDTGAGFEVATLHGIPLYDGDVEREQGLPQAVVELKERIAACDGLLLGTPEYNNGVPGVFKNAIDWCSRPGSDIPRVFGGRPVAMVGASPGGFGTVLSQNGWLPVLRTLGMLHWTGSRLMVSRANTVLDPANGSVDGSLQPRLAEFLGGFVAFVRAMPARA